MSISTIPTGSANDHEVATRYRNCQDSGETQNHITCRARFRVAQSAVGVAIRVPRLWDVALWLRSEQKTQHAALRISIRPPSNLIEAFD